MLKLKVAKTQLQSELVVKYGMQRKQEMLQGARQLLEKHSVRSTTVDSFFIDYYSIGELIEQQNNQVQLAQQRLEVLAELEFLQPTSLNLTQTLQRICEIGTQLMPATGGVSVLLCDAKQQGYEIAATTVKNQEPKEVLEKIRTTGGATHWIIENALDLIVTDIKDDPFNANPMLGKYNLKGYIGTPIIFDQTVIGVLYCLNKETRIFSDDDINFLHILAKRASAAIQMTKFYENMYEHATTDQLTGLPNRRLLDQFAQIAFARHIRSKSNFAVVSLDLDFFKQVNDTYGHPVGDTVLRITAQHLLENSRSGDLIARIGGEEFMMILPETNHPQAKQVAERVRQRISTTPYETSKGPLNVTASFGVASGQPTNASQLATYLNAADEALYRAKNSGKNTVISQKVKSY